ncbi:hypothetical protein [Dyadobacter psychrotolerans]|uniref:Uncharacterized protein n=1 Tax=Dyadobacter psychrotolerans TaxID=2541721 RepID=A0A4R5DL27_9BACT|nr:hypothetical protein [Dyadobacter psychrotolerans]TDE14779.1 hypothetical protein E0F88_16465 [Dyadobacter psychrotolerans]
MQKIDSNKVDVVSLGSGMVPESSLTWQDIVNKQMKYFHPVSGRGGWPKEPPNYIAFRYNGKLQGIHHIERYEVFTNPNLYITEIAEQVWPAHFMYFLGERILPPHEVKTGSEIIKSLRVWAALDLLLTSKTIGEGREKQRSEKNRSCNLKNILAAFLQTKVLYIVHH